MSIHLRVGIIIVGLLIFVITLSTLKKDKMPVKYSLIWLFSSLLILALGLFPNILVSISKIIGFITMSNFVVGIFIFILLMITLFLTVIISKQEKKIVLLIQEISMLKEEKNEK